MPKRSRDFDSVTRPRDARSRGSRGFSRITDADPRITARDADSHRVTEADGRASAVDELYRRRRGLASSPERRFEDLGAAASSSSILAGVLAAGLRKVRPAAATAADDGRQLLDEPARLDAAGQILRDRHDERHFAVDFGDEDDDPAAETIAERVRQAAERALLDALDAPRDELRRPTRRGLSSPSAPGAAVARAPPPSATFIFS